LVLLLAAGAIGAATEEEVAAFVAQVRSPDGAVRQAAVERAAEMGAAAIVPLGALLGQEDRNVVRSAEQALERIVAHAVRPGAEAERAAVSLALLNLIPAEQPARTREWGFRLLGWAAGDEAVPALAALLADADRREWARRTLEQIASPAAVQALLDALPRVPPDFQVALINSLGQLRAKAAVPTLLRRIQEGPNEVRLAILQALGNIGDVQAQPIFDLALTMVPVDARPLILDPYLRLAENLLAQGQVDTALEIYGKILQAAPTEQHRCAALLGWGRIGRPETIPRLLPYLAEADLRVRAAAQEALQNLPAAEVNLALHQALPTAEPAVKAALLRVLVARQDPNVAPLLQAATQDASAEVRVTAFDLLGQVDDPALEPTLLEAAERGSELVKPVALAGCLRLADRRAKQGEAEAARAMYHRVLELASQDDQRRQALNGLAAVPDPAALPWVQPWLDSPVREDAMAAAIAIAGTLAETRKEEAIALLSSLLQRKPPRGLANAAAARLRDLGRDTTAYARQAGFVTHWWLTGPFPSPEKAAWEKVYFPEQEIALEKEYEVEGQKYRWKAWVCPDVQGITDLRAQFTPADNVAAYAYAEVTVEADQEVDFRIGSDDDVVCWLNGERIHANPASRPLVVDQDVVHTRLQAGVNRILLKVLQGGGQWEFCLRITDREGNPVAFTERME